MDIRKKLPLIVGIVTCGGTYIVVATLLSQIFEKEFIASHSVFGALIACGMFFLAIKIANHQKIL
jgi:hypothetical protein